MPAKILKFETREERMEREFRARILHLRKLWARQDDPVGKAAVEVLDKVLVLLDDERSK